MYSEAWEGVHNPPLSLGKSTVDYLRDLQDRFDSVRSYAEAHNAQAQKRCVSRYNLRAREKHFQVGDLVLLLSPDTTSARTFNKWNGPARVVQVCLPHSYH